MLLRGSHDIDIVYEDVVRVGLVEFGERHDKRAALPQQTKTCSLWNAEWRSRFAKVTRMLITSKLLPWNLALSKPYHLQL